MQPVEIKENIYWVGAVDWDIRDFHGYSTDKGTTYNAFLVIDEKKALFDTVKKNFKSQLVNNISKIVDPSRIDYIIVNHVEMDHSGSLPEILEIVKPEKIICSPSSKKALLAHFHRDDWPYEVVDTGETISLGKKTIQFIETKMLHWPDSMFSYLQEDKLLISSDAFGQHWATSERFDDEVDPSELFQHAAKYYANILLPLSPLVTKLLSQIEKMGLEVDLIAPDHGLIWRNHPGRIIEAYATWSQQKPKKKALVIYDTMWYSTDAMARAIAEGLVLEGVKVKMFDLRVNHRSDIMTEVLDARAIILGSPTLNNGVLPKMADMLTYMKGLRPRNKIGAAFGSYGWSGEAVKLLNQAMEEMKFRVIDPGIRVNYVPSHDDLKQCEALGRKIGKAIQEEVIDA
jgi:flavorubredoxin